MLNFTIIGAGNIGSQFAAHCAAKNHRVTICSSKPDKFGHSIKLVDEHGNTKIDTGIFFVTDNAALAVKNADIIFVTVPTFMMPDTACGILPFVKEGAAIGLVPGTGGGEYAFGSALVW